MKASVLLITLLSAAFSLTAQKEALRYRLNLGDEYHYKMTESGDGTFEFNASDWVTFKVLDKVKGKYILSFTYNRSTLQSGDYILDTRSASKSAEKNSWSYKYRLGKEFVFSLSQKGEVECINLHQLVKQINQEAASKGELRSYSLNKWMDYVAGVEQTIESFFVVFSEKREPSWTIFRKSKTGNRKDLKQYKIVRETDDEIGIAYHWDMDSDTTKINDLFWTYPLSMEIDGEICIDKTTSMPVSITKSINQHLIFFRRLSSSKEFKKEEHKRSNYFETKQVDHLSVSFLPVDIVGKNESLTPWDSIKFSTNGMFNSDKELSQFVLHRGESEKYYLKTKLQGPVVLRSTLRHEDQYISNAGDLILEQGDSVFFSVGRNNELQFSGVDALKTNLKSEMEGKGKKINTKDTPEQALLTIKSNIEEKQIFIQQYKDSLSGWAYTYLNTELYYYEYLRLFNHYRFKTQGVYDETFFRKLFSGIDFNSYYNCASSGSFRLVIEMWIKEQRKIYHYDKPWYLQVPYEWSYLYAKTVLLGEVRYYAMARYVSQSIASKSKDNYESIYHDFLLEYPGTEFAEMLQKDYEGVVAMSLGEKAPNFTLRTIADSTKNVSLEDYRGKFVMLGFVGYGSENTRQGNILQWKEMVSVLPSKDFELLLVFLNNEKRTAELLDRYSIDAVLLEDYDQDCPVIEMYRPHGHYLINPQGEIEFKGTNSGYSQFLINYIQEELRKRMNKPSMAKETLLGILLTVVVLSLLFLGIFKWRTDFLKKKTAREREQLDLEMTAVRAQLNPHFLFNSMSSIQHLVTSGKNENANIFLSKFASLMRKVLNQAELNLIPLKDELQTIETYLELEALRHQFNFEMETAENVDVYTVEVPPMLLQPFVENAVIHGVNGNKDGQIIVRTQKEDKCIKICIIDNGKGLTVESREESNGKGLHLTRRRVNLMKQTFKNEIEFELRDRSETEGGESGVIAEIWFNIES